MLSNSYGAAFGFTDDEVARLLNAEAHPEQMADVRRWYNGYRVGGSVVYNSWSIVGYLDDPDHELKPHWVNSASNELIHDLLIRHGMGLNTTMEALLRRESIRVMIDEHLVLRDVPSNPGAIWTLLLFSGYLKVNRVYEGRRGHIIADLSLPNEEVVTAFEQLFAEWLTSDMNLRSGLDPLHEALFECRVSELEQYLSSLLLKCLSYHDTGGRDPEKLYHGFIIGLLVGLSDSHEVRSNRESGFGRADVLVRPRQPGQPGVVMELKVLQEGETVDHALESALAQIKARAYTTELQSAGASPIVELGVVFDGKKVWVRSPAPAVDPVSGSTDLAIRQPVLR